MILEKLLAKDPDQRYQSMVDVEAALDSFVTQDGASKGLRRSRPIAAQPDPTDVARNSDLIPRPVKMLDTPWPPAQADTLDKPLAQRRAAAHADRAQALGDVRHGRRRLAGRWHRRRDGDARQQRQRHEDRGHRARAGDPLPAAATTPAPKETAPSKVAVELNANVPNARVTFRRRVAAARRRCRSRRAISSSSSRSRRPATRPCATG